MLAKRIFSILFVCCSLLGMNIQTFAEEQYALIDAETGTVNVTDWGYKQYITTGGYRLIALNNLAEGHDKLYIDLDDSYMYAKYGLTAEVEITCYVKGAYRLSLGYAQMNSDNLFEEKATDSKWFVGAGSLQTQTFSLTDAAFNNACSVGSGSDLYLQLDEFRDAEEIGIKSIKITKKTPKVPVIFNVTGNSYGNIFGTTQGFTVQLSNISDKLYSTDVKYYVVDEDGETVHLSSVTKNVASGGKANVRITTNISKYGLYTLKIDAETSDGIYSELVPFSVINETANGVTNSKLQLVTHLARYGSVNEVVNTIKRAGFGGTRDEIFWSSVEVVESVLEVPASDDAIQNVIFDAGLESMLILCYGNPFYDNTTPFNSSIVPHSDDGIKAFAAYCGHMAKQYKGKIKYYEIWNEYNLEYFNAENRGPDVYAKLLKAAHDAIVAEDKEAKIVAMATVGVDSEFVSEVLSYGVEEYIDVISVHPYQYSGYSEEKMLNQVSALKEVLGELDIPIWYTENGWSTSIGDSRSVTEYKQAIYGIRSYVYSQAKQLCDRTYWYDIQNDSSNDAEHEGNFGIIDAANGVKVPGAAKPLYVAFAGMNKLLANAEFSSGIEKENVYAYNFKGSDGKNIAVLWGTEGEEVILKLGTDKINVLDMYTNVTESKTSYTNAYRITLAEEPIYITGEFSEFSEGNENDLITFGASVSAAKAEINEEEQYGFNLNIESNAENEIDAVLNIKVTSEDGSVVSYENTNINIAPYSLSVKPYKLQKLSAGIYTIEITLSGDGIEVSLDTEFLVNEVLRSNSISFENSNVVISGVTALADTDVTIYMTDGENTYTNQIVSEDDCTYSAQIPVSYENEFIVLVNNGEIYMKEISTVDIRLLNGDKEIDNLINVTDGADLNMLVSTNENAGLKIYTAVYDKYDTLVSAHMGGDVRLTVNKIDEIGKIVCFVWTDYMKPIEYRIYDFE